MQKTIKDYVSEIDKKLAEFDASHNLSASQQAEIAKYQRIYQLRDQKVRDTSGLETHSAEDKIWEDF